jgi:hypothetical protein
MYEIYLLELLYANWSTLFVKTYCAHFATHTYLFPNSINTFFEILTKLKIIRELSCFLFQNLFVFGWFLGIYRSFVCLWVCSVNRSASIGKSCLILVVPIFLFLNLGRTDKACLLSLFFSYQLEDDFFYPDYRLLLQMWQTLL